MISRGFAEPERTQLASMYWQAFGAKLGKVMGPDDKAIRFLTGVLNPDYLLAARGHDGELLGAAGFKTRDGGLVGGGIGDLWSVYGALGTMWRVPFLSLLERSLEPDILQMDGIFVTQEARGMGVGTALLTEITELARAQGKSKVRLDVIDTNPRARALYERQGFVATKVEHTGPLRHIFGFRYATRMELSVSPTMD